MNQRFLIAIFLLAAFCAVGKTLAQENKGARDDVVRIGGVASSPKVITIFKNLKVYLNREGFRSDFVLYSDPKALVDALDRGEVDIAWTSPVPHAMYHLRAGGSQTLAMRDVDQDLRVTLIAATESGIRSPKDLAGKRLVLGSTGNAEGALLPVHFLKNEGVELNQVKIVSLDKERDSAGRRANTSLHVLQALEQGRGEAAVVLEQVWNDAKDWRNDNPTIRQIWTSPDFCHCTFTAPKDFDAKLGGQFTRLITNMDPKDPLVAELNRLENAKTWIPADSGGYEALYEALENKSELLPAINK